LIWQALSDSATDGLKSAGEFGNHRSENEMKSTAPQPPFAGADATCGAPASEPPALPAAPLLARTLGELIDAYMAAYAGRDSARGYRLATWRARLGERALAELTDDDVFHTLEAIGAEPARVYVGRGVDGAPVHRAKGKRSPGTLNRYHASLAAVFNWGIKHRRVPKGFENPCRQVPRQPERPGIVRFLSEDERTRLLAACRASKWQRLYVLVVMAITTGARRSELLGLRWRDIDLTRADSSSRVVHRKLRERSGLEHLAYCSGPSGRSDCPRDSRVGSSVFRFFCWSSLSRRRSRHAAPFAMNASRRSP
jgi:integrase